MHHDKLTETALLIMEKVVKNELEEELPEDLRLVSLSFFSETKAPEYRVTKISTVDLGGIHKGRPGQGGEGGSAKSGHLRTGGEGGQRQMRTRPQTEFQTENFRFSIEFFHFLTIDAYPFWLITVHIICDQCSVCT